MTSLLQHLLIQMLILHIMAFLFGAWFGITLEKWLSKSGKKDDDGVDLSDE